jgi:hypothetical protein
LTHYPAQYTLLCYSDDDLPRRASKIFNRFSDIYDLDITQAVTALVMALQGDEEIDGGANPHQPGADDEAGASSSEMDETNWDEEEVGYEPEIPAHISMNESQAGTGIDGALLKT